MTRELSKCWDECRNIHKCDIGTELRLNCESSQLRFDNHVKWERFKLIMALDHGVKSSQPTSQLGDLKVPLSNCNQTDLRSTKMSRTNWLAIKWCHEPSYGFHQSPKWVSTYMRLDYQCHGDLIVYGRRPEAAVGFSVKFDNSRLNHKHQA